MNNDYLWDKSGEDREIEGLEDLLSGQRYQQTAPPALPVAVELNTAAKAPWWKFSLAFAVPACLLAVVLIGFWMARQGTELQAFKQDNNVPLQIFVPQEPVKESEAVEPEIAKDAAPKPVKTIFTPEAKKRSNRAVNTAYRRPQTKFDSLTSEERFAYDQLMLALSITGSKLKVVSDTINRTED